VTIYVSFSHARHPRRAGHGRHREGREREEELTTSECENTGVSQSRREEGVAIVIMMMMIQSVHSSEQLVNSYQY
jgi:hypothetical protein